MRFRWKDHICVVEVTDGVPEVVVDVEIDAETTGGDPTPDCNLE